MFGKNGHSIWHLNILIWERRHIILLCQIFPECQMVNLFLSVKYVQSIEMESQVLNMKGLKLKSLLKGRWQSMCPLLSIILHVQWLQMKSEKRMDVRMCFAGRQNRKLPNQVRYRLHCIKMQTDGSYSFLEGRAILKIMKIV